MPGLRPLAVFIAALALYLLTAGGSLTSSDAVITFELTRSLVERQSIALPGNLLGSEGNQGRDGRYYSQFGIGHSLYNVPFYVAGRAVADLLPRPIGKPDTLPKAAVALGSAVAAAIAVALIWLLALRLTGDAQAALLASASAAIASPLWPYSKFGFSTALTAATLAGVAFACWNAASKDSVRSAAAAGGLLAFGWLTRHEMALFAVPFAAFLALHGRRRAPVAAFLALTAAGGLLWMLYNAVRFGRATAVGYSPSFGLEGYVAYFMSPAGSILIFCPIAIVWIIALVKCRANAAGLLLLLGGPLVVSYLFYGALADWPGGRSYGPRYLVPALTLLAPALAVALHANHISRRAVIAAIALGAILQLPGVVVDYSKVSLDWARGATRDDVANRNWRLASSPLVLNARAMIRAIPDNAAYLTGARPMPRPAVPADPEDRGFAQQFSFSLDFWWLYLVYLRALGRFAALAIAAALALVTGIAVRVAWIRD
jgi:Dolichyl-phosphate-mannose-protein mannosyltransferase